MDKALERAKHLNHQPTLQFMSLHHYKHKYHHGNRLSIIESQKLVEEIKQPTLNAQAKIYLGLSLVNMSKAKVDQDEGIEIVLKACDDIVLRWGKENAPFFFDYSLVVSYIFLKNVDFEGIISQM